MKTLTPKGKQTLRIRAHDLKPVVMIAEKGLTENVMKEIDRALFDHELIKIKILAEDRAGFSSIVDSIETHLNTECVQKIGHIAVFYKKSDKTNLKRPV